MTKPYANTTIIDGYDNIPKCAYNKDTILFVKFDDGSTMGSDTWQVLGERILKIYDGNYDKYIKVVVDPEDIIILLETGWE